MHSIFQKQCFYIHIYIQFCIALVRIWFGHQLYKPENIDFNNLEACLLKKVQRQIVQEWNDNSHQGLKEFPIIFGEQPLSLGTRVVAEVTPTTSCFKQAVLGREKKKCFLSFLRRLQKSHIPLLPPSHCLVLRYIYLQQSLVNTVFLLGKVIVSSLKMEFCLYFQIIKIHKIAKMMQRGPHMCLTQFLPIVSS